jgi:hypothetical protein
MKNTIKRILSEEVDRKTQALLSYTQKNGLIQGSLATGGYKNLKQVLKGTDYLTRECMINTIKDYFIQPTSKSYLDLNQDLGLEHIEIEKGKDYLITLNGISKNRFGYIVYELDKFDDYNEVHQTQVPYDAREVGGEYMLETIHLYELVDGVMEKYEKDTSDKWD